MTDFSNYKIELKEVLLAATPLMATLAWKDLLDDLVRRIVPDIHRDNIPGKVIYALILTFVVILIANTIKANL
jgi:hypothetical protein